MLLAVFGFDSQVLAVGPLACVPCLHTDVSSFLVSFNFSRSDQVCSQLSADQVPPTAADLAKALRMRSPTRLRSARVTWQREMAMRL